MQSKQRKECMSILAALSIYALWHKLQGQRLVVCSLIHFGRPTLRVIFSFQDKTL